MIILTGPDNTGKTTLTQKLSEYLGVEPIPKFEGKPWLDPEMWFFWLYKHAKESIRGKLVLADRFYVDDLVYGPILRDGLTLGPETNKIVEDMLIRIKPLIIVTLNPVEKIKESYHEREQYPDLEHIEKLCEGFQELPELWPYCDMEVITYDYTQDSFEMLKLRVDDYIKGRKK